MSPLEMQVERMLHLADEVLGGVGGLATDALDVIGRHAGVKLVLASAESSGNGCSVAGSYIGTTDPPTLAVAMSASPRRRQFTVLHEFGHHLQNSDVDLAVRARQQPDGSSFEEDACDRFAARVLIADGDVAVAFPSGRVTADGVRTLFERTAASRAACASRAAQALGTTGVVTVLDDTGTVTFAARRGDIYPPKRGSDQSTNPLLRRALDGRRDVTERDTHIQYSTGHTSDLLYGQAAWVGDMLITVQVVDQAGWLPYSVARPGTAKTAASAIWETCEICDANYLVRGLHTPCGEPRCPNGHCGCTTARDRACPRCNLVKPPHQFRAGATSCVDCE